MGGGAVGAVLPGGACKLPSAACTAMRSPNPGPIPPAGGHAFLGLHAAKKLLAQGHKVTILNDGDQVCCCLGKAAALFQQR